MSKQSRIGCLIACVICLGAAGLAGRGIWISLEAEHNLQAVAVFAAALMDFIEHHERWPTDEDELVSAANGHTSIYVWPRDANRIMGRVRVQYGIPLSDVAAQDPDSFAYVIGSEPNFHGSARMRYVQLIETAKHYAATDTASEPHNQ